MTKRSVTKKPKLTQWFDGSVKPVRDGVYEREYSNGKTIAYAKFENGLWFCFSPTVKMAYVETCSTSLQNRRWRGLAQNPEVQP